MGKGPLNSVRRSGGFSVYFCKMSEQPQIAEIYSSGQDLIYSLVYIDYFRRSPVHHAIEQNTPDVWTEHEAFLSHQLRLFLSYLDKAGSKIFLRCSGLNRDKKVSGSMQNKPL
jgi:hypothetical protein